MAAAYINQGVRQVVGRFVDVTGEDHAAVAADVEFVGLQVAHVQHRLRLLLQLINIGVCPGPAIQRQQRDRDRQRHGQYQHRLIQPQRAGAGGQHGGDLRIAV